MNIIDLSTRRDVITSCDHGTCPDIKSNNEINTVIVVKSDGNLQSIEAATNHGDDNQYKLLEICEVEGAHQ